MTTPPLSLEAAFDRAMAAFPPFPGKPELAVAVSGGVDSRTLVLLAERWVRYRGGRAVALLVDHGLRPESAEEIRATAEWLAGKNIEAHCFRVTVPKGNVQAAARAARYEALLTACRARGLLHLLLGHHAGDKRETLLMRLVRGSGAEGMAGLRSIDYRREARLLRPLLACEPEAIRQWLKDRGERWIEDASNDNPAFRRVRLRPLAATLRQEGWHAEKIERQQAWFEREAARDRAEDARFLSCHATLHPAGFVKLSLAAWATLVPPQDVRLLRRLLAWVRGEGEVRWQEAERLALSLCSHQPFRGGTLHGCRILPHRSSLYICRETKDESGDLAALKTAHPKLPAAWPAALLASLPVVRLLDGSLCLPHITPAPAGAAPCRAAPRQAAPRPFSPAESAC